MASSATGPSSPAKGNSFIAYGSPPLSRKRARELVAENNGKLSMCQTVTTNFSPPRTFKMLAQLPASPSPVHFSDLDLSSVPQSVRPILVAMLGHMQKDSVKVQELDEDAKALREVNSSLQSQIVAQAELLQEHSDILYKYVLPEGAHQRFAVMDVLGCIVESLDAGAMEAAAGLEFNFGPKVKYFEILESLPSFAGECLYNAEMVLQGGERKLLAELNRPDVSLQDLRQMLVKLLEEKLLQNAAAHPVMLSPKPVALRILNDLEEKMATNSIKEVLGLEPIWQHAIRRTRNSVQSRRNIYQI